MGSVVRARGRLPNEIVVASVRSILAGVRNTRAGFLSALAPRATHRARALPFRFVPPAEVGRAMRVWQARIHAVDPTSPIRRVPHVPAYGLVHRARSPGSASHRAAYNLLSPDASGSDATFARDVPRSPAAPCPHAAFHDIAAVAARLAVTTWLEATPLPHTLRARQTVLAYSPTLPFLPAVENSKRQSSHPCNGVRALGGGGLLAGEGASPAGCAKS